MRTKLLLTTFAITYIVLGFVVNMVLKLYWQNGGPDWMYWVSQVIWSIAIVFVGILGFIQKSKLRDFSEKLKYKANPFWDRPSIPIEFFFGILVLVGIVGLLIALRSIMMGCPAPGC